VVAVGLALAATACYPWPDTPTGNFVGYANAEVGWQNPPYAAGGFWCYKFVNAIGEATIPGWQDATGPGTFTYYLRPDPSPVPQPGDVVEFNIPGMAPGEAGHDGIVLAASPGSFESIEGNSPEDPSAVVINNRPTSGPDPRDGYTAIAFLLPTG
jgi:hypothetical protein